MIKKLRRKFVIVMMSIVAAFLVGIFTVMFLTTKANLERMSLGSLHRALSSRGGHGLSEAALNLPDAPPPPGEEPDAEGQKDDWRDWREGDDQPFENLAVILVSVDSSGQVEILQNPMNNLDEEALSELALTLENSSEDQGVVEAYQLRYARRQMEDGSTRYALADVSIERGILRMQVLHSLVTYLGASALFFLFSVLLSRWMVGPVERAWERQRQFVADASHELKTPLTVLLSNAEMLSNSGALTDEKNLRRLDHIQAESLRMKGLVEDLLTLARSDSGRQALSLSPVNFSYIVTLSALTLEPMIYDQGRKMELRVEDNLMVLGDAVKLRQLTDILLDNARKYGAPKSSIEVELARSGKRDLLLRVVSHGTPIPPEELTMIFERFYRSDKSRGEEKGYGLGLSIAQAIVQDHGGRIWAQSDGVSSNTFSVSLPRSQGQAQET